MLRMAVEWKECSRLAINLAIKITCQCLWQHSCRTSSWEILVALGVQTVEFQCLQLSTSNQFAERNHLYTRAGHKPTKHPGCIAENRMYFTRIQYFAWNLYWSLSSHFRLLSTCVAATGGYCLLWSTRLCNVLSSILLRPCYQQMILVQKTQCCCIQPWWYFIIFQYGRRNACNITKQVFPASQRFNFKPSRFAQTGNEKSTVAPLRCEHVRTDGIR